MQTSVMTLLGVIRTAHCRNNGCTIIEKQGRLKKSHNKGYTSMKTYHSKDIFFI